MRDLTGDEPAATPEPATRYETSSQPAAPLSGSASRSGSTLYPARIPDDPPPVAAPLVPAPSPPEESSYPTRMGQTPTEMPSLAVLEGWPTIPGYEILARLGRGGMGVVFKARHLHLNRLVALKMLRAGSQAEAEDLVRFFAEAEAVAQLQHPNIVQIHEVGRNPAQPYFTMELLAGGSLGRALAGDPQAPAPAAQLMETVARAAHYAHTQGIIHRDLKPGNILLTADGTPKITDFGLAKRLHVGDGLTHTGSVLGTPSYMGPEQARGQVRSIGPAADIYALGAILYEMLTGRPPFKGATPTDTILQVLNVEPVPPTRLQPGLPRDLETICLKCLEKEPGKRYPTALALAEDLQRFRQDQPIRARPVRTTERAWRWCRRNPTVAGLLTALVLVLGAGLAGVIWKWREAAHERDLQAEARAAAVQASEEAKSERDSAERARREAELAATRAQAINDFLVKDLLGEAAPEKNPRHQKITVEELLSRAAQKIAGRFEGQPLVEAVIRQTIGDTCRALGDYATAQTHLERALSLYRQELGEDHLDVLHSVNNLAVLYMDQGQFAQAEPLFTQALEIRRRLLGGDHPDTFNSLNNLAYLHHRQGHYSQAESLYKQALEGRQRLLGEHHPDTLVSLNNLGGLYKSRGQYALAEPLYTRVLELRRQVLGAEHPVTLISMNNLAALYHDHGKYSQAEQLYTQALQIRRRVLGEDHPNTLISLNNLSVLYRDQARYAEAEPLLRQILKAQRQRYGNDHLQVAGTLVDLGLNLLQQQKYSQAEPLLREALVIREQKLPDDWRRFDCQSLLGASLTGQQKYAEAERFLVTGYEGMTQRRDKIPANARGRLTEALDRLVHLYEAWDKPAKATEWRARRDQETKPPEKTGR